MRSYHGQIRAHAAKLRAEHGAGMTVVYCARGCCYENGTVRRLMGGRYTEHIAHRRGKALLSVRHIPRLLFGLGSLYVSGEPSTTLEQITCNPYDGLCTAGRWGCRVGGAGVVVVQASGHVVLVASPARCFCGQRCKNGRSCACV